MTQAPSLRVLTLNTWNLDGPWAERCTEIAAWFDRVAPDVACFQEVVQGPEGDTTADAVTAESAQALHVAFAGIDVAAGIRAGVAVLSRWPIDEEAAEPLPHEDGASLFDRSMPVLHARTGGLDVFTTHLAAPPWCGAVRRRQVVAVADMVPRRAEPSSALPPVVAMDDNAQPDSDEIRFLTGLATIDGASTSYQEAWRVAGDGTPGLTWDRNNLHTWHNGAHDQRIDYVFVGDHWGRPGDAGRVEAARVVCDRPLTGTLASDHYGLLVELAWPDRPH
ncbi:hypothetical protein BH24ACT3_BH24ACT3_04240 [soil metagenome]